MIKRANVEKVKNMLKEEDYRRKFIENLYPDNTDADPYMASLMNLASTEAAHEALGTKPPFSVRHPILSGIGDTALLALPLGILGKQVLVNELKSKPAKTRKFAKKIENLDAEMPEAHEGVQSILDVLPFGSLPSSLLQPHTYRRAGIATGLASAMGKEAPFSVRHPITTELGSSLAGGGIGGGIGAALGAALGGTDGALIGGLGLGSLGSVAGNIIARMHRKNQIKKIIQAYKDTPEENIDPSKIDVNSKGIVGSLAQAFVNPPWQTGRQEAKAMHA